MTTTPPATATAVVFAGGDAPTARSLDALPIEALLVAADSGVAHALEAGLAVDLVVGDLDSVRPAHLEAAVAAGATVQRHPADKDATDLALAIDAARTRGADRIVVLGIGGGRLDHFLANMLLLASPAFADLEIEAHVGVASATVVRRTTELHGTTGELLTLLAVGGAARSVTTEGLRYALRGEDLLPGSSRGVSNEFAVPTARVSLAAGVLLAIRPGGA